MVAKREQSKASRGDIGGPVASAEILTATAQRARDLAKWLRSSGAPQDYIAIVEEAASLLTLCAADREPWSSTPACDNVDDPAPEMEDATWLGG